MSLTFDEAKRCPRCYQPGKDVSQSTRANGTVDHWIYCSNPLCLWFDTLARVVSVLRDGTLYGERS